MAGYKAQYNIIQNIPINKAVANVYGMMLKIVLKSPYIRLIQIATDKVRRISIKNLEIDSYRKSMSFLLINSANLLVFFSSRLLSIQTIITSNQNRINIVSLSIKLITILTDGNPRLAKLEGIAEFTKLARD